MKRRFGALFRAFTVVLLVVSAWTTYANVYSDRAEVSAQAEQIARKAAGCGATCRFSGMRVSRGMLEESVTYDVVGSGTYMVACRRAYVAVGDYACAVSPR